MQFKNYLYEPNDPTYLKEEVFYQEKEYFRILSNLIKNRFQDKSISIIDIGCASGAFLYYLNQKVSIKSATGIDISDRHIEIAKEKMPDMEFIQNSIFNIQDLKLPNYDVCTLLGTMSIFDEIEKVIYNSIQLIKDNGVLYIFDLFNDEPVDMLMRYKRSSKNEKWSAGFNVTSLKSCKDIFYNLNNKFKLTFHPFELKAPIKKSKDPMRAWTIKTSSNDNQIIVGTGQMLNFKILEVSY